MERHIKSEKRLRAEKMVYARREKILTDIRAKAKEWDSRAGERAKEWKEREKLFKEFTSK